MPSKAKPRIVVLYGSQKGQAQSIAEGIAAEAEEHGLLAELSCLDQKDKDNLENEKSPVVFVVSTTGNGEPPDNALQFVRHIKMKTLSPIHYKHLHYALLALGNTNYENFCNCGKTIERRLQELGAQKFYATGYADDGVGLELVVEPWLEGLWKAVKGALTNMTSNLSIKDDSERTLPDGLIPDVQIDLLSLTDHQSPELEPECASMCSASATQAVSPSGGVVSLTPPAQETQNMHLGASNATSLSHSVSPLSDASLNVPALPPPFLEVSLQEVDTVDEISGPLKSETLNEVPISRAVRLTTGESVKTAIFLELDISAYPMLAYQPGDSFDVFCPNRASEVKQLLKRVGLEDQKNHHVHVSLLKNTKKRGAQVPPYIPQNISLLYLLTWCLEIRSVPKKAFLRALAEHTTDSMQRRRLLELCSKQGTADYNLHVRESSLSLLELLAAFPSSLPPLSLLVEHLPKLQPRPYSAASSCLQHPGKLNFVLNVVEFPECSGRPVGRRGLCTGWLFDLVNDALVLPGAAETQCHMPLPRIHVSLRPNCFFRHPPDLSAPLIMVGPGTGVAPFIGFLQQREKQRQQNPDAVFGETWLFFGCRYRDRDYLFREELEGFVSRGTLDHLKVCFSRDEPKEDDAVVSGRPPRYVQHNLLLHSHKIINIWLKHKGCLYVCGCDCECDCCLSPCAMQLGGNQFRVYSASYPMTAGVCSSTPVTLVRISGSENGWMDVRCMTLQWNLQPRRLLKMNFTQSIIQSNSSQIWLHSVLQNVLA
ncbi:methionine synthase reductase isoform X2 [Syngnathoides biaculeatus]|uniref:methionine synthase reductase isoform X2 n=1 Tax=Syngnathoides biaculeatus TaxID=300417 RepID=UPI002ADD7244|nr:methionine synthase reductase isoform X2 [Syngnathoides biaculeatus]